MRRGPYRLVMAVAFAAAGCQTSCDELCDTGAEALVSGNLAAAVEGDDPSCGGVEGLRLVLETVSGDGQFSPIGSRVQPAPTVRLLTAFARTPVQDVPVVFRIASGGGRFDQVDPLDQVVTIETDADGHATIPNWVLGTSPGINSITAEVDGIPLNASIGGTPRTITVTATPAATIAVFTGNTQTGAAGGALAVDPEVIVLDGDARPVQNYPVEFAVTGGGGQLIHPFALPRITDFSGRVKTRWILGTAAGPNTLTVTATGPGLTGSPITFTATGVAGTARTLAIHAGNGQSALRNTAVAVDPAVRLVDEHDNPVVGATVTFSVLSGAGTVQGSPATTDVTGVATVAGWTLGPVEGENRLRAEVTGTGIVGNPAEFVATGTAPQPALVVAFAGTNQTVAAGQLLVDPAVLVTDAQGAPVAGVTVTFSHVIAPGFFVGFLTGAVQVTGADGVATVGEWAVGTNPGQYRILATTTPGTVTGSPIGFTATVTAGPPFTIVKVSGDNGSAPVGFQPELLPRVLVRDAHNNPVAGVTVTFAIVSGGGTIPTGAVQVTDAQGRATVGSWTLGPAAGPNTMSATAAGVATVLSFNATGFLVGARAQPAPDVQRRLPR